MEINFPEISQNGETSPGKMINIGIIGSAGRGSDINRLNADIYEKMIGSVSEKIQKIASESPNTCITLVSGGAAWADHIAVILWNRNEPHVSGLKLYLPAKWLSDIPRFLDNGCSDSYINPGKYANMYHRAFADKTGIDSLNQIEQAIIKGAIIDDTNKGFHARNTKIAEECDVLIALTFGPDKYPRSGGTLDTWKKSKTNRKIHIPIGKL